MLAIVNAMRVLAPAATSIAPPAAVGPAAPLPRTGPVEPRDAARDADFGHPTYGSAGAARVLDRLMAESGPPAEARRRTARADTRPLPFHTADDFLRRPTSALVKAYVAYRRAGDTTSAARLRQGAMAAYGSEAAHAALHIGSWLANVDTFLARGDDLKALAVRQADVNLKPFAVQVVDRQVRRGLQRLELDASLPPVLTGVATVLADADVLRQDRLNDIDDFYYAAQTSGAIVGLPGPYDYTTHWLRDGRLVFRDAAVAADMAPRVVWVSAGTEPHVRHYPRFGPLRRGKPHAMRVDYVDPNFVRTPWNFAEDGFRRITYAPSHDGNTDLDEYRLGEGPWRRFANSTTPEQESMKSRGLYHLRERAIEGVGRAPRG